MAPTLTTKWFIYVKTLEFYEGLQQCNLLTVHCLSDWGALKPKMMTDFIKQAAYHLIFIGVLETPFKYHLMAFNKHSFGLQYD